MRTTIKKEQIPLHPNIIFMGTPDFAVPTLQALVENSYNILAVITQPDRRKGRGQKISFSPVKEASIKYNLEVLQPASVSEPGICEMIRHKKPDLLVVVAFGQLLKREFLAIPLFGAINIHASLLPKYRGPAPIQWAILNNDKKTGLTAMLMDEGLDTGHMILQEELEIDPEETCGQLHDKLANMSAAFILETLNHISLNRFDAIPQNELQSTYAPKIDKNKAQINWHQSARTIAILSRALDSWPGAFTTLGNKKIKLFSPLVIDNEDKETTPGKIRGLMDGSFMIETGQGLILFKEIQVAGKKRLPVRDFLHGFSMDEGTILGQ